MTASSPDMVSEDRIAALVAAAQEGRLDEESDAPKQRQPTVRRMSFTRPTKFTHDQQRRLRRTHETFCRKVAGRLAGELRVPVDLEVIAIAQHTWGNAHAELHASSVCAVLEVGGHGTRMLLAGELNLAIALIELMLGGSLDSVPKERKLSDIDWALTRRMFGGLAEDLSLIWQDAAGVELGLAGFESQADAGELSLVSEPTLALTAEVRIGRLSSTLNLLIPYRSIEPVADRLSGAHGRDGEVGLKARRHMSHALSEVEVQVRAEVGAIEMPLARAAALAPGDLIEFDALAANGITLCVGSAPIGIARPGQSGGRRAVQFERALEVHP
jgi:flagellar motor switch protein FliM